MSTSLSKSEFMYFYACVQKFIGTLSYVKERKINILVCDVLMIKLLHID